MSTVKLYTGEIDGKLVTYSSETTFFIQVGKGAKGGYKTKYVIIGNLVKAWLNYDGINIGNGYKKRLLMPSCSKSPVLAKQSS